MTFYLSPGIRFLLFFFIWSVDLLMGQSLPQTAINIALANRSPMQPALESKNSGQLNRDLYKSGVYPFLQNTIPKVEQIRERLSGGGFSPLNDTVYVGEVPGDTLIISGPFFNNGPVLVFNDGVLIFDNANATILGDVYVFQDGKLFCDSSVLNFPQLYFYHRGMIVANNGQLNISNTTLDYGGLSHSLAVVENASVIMTNITNIGFTTAGGYGNASITIDGTNQAGEFIMKDSASFSFSNANTVLLWHHVPVNAVLDISFPPGATVSGYTFNNTSAGVTGIGYDVSLTNCTDVMWSLMPAAGSDVTISSSTIRAIGLWFEGSDTVNASGLVNNSNYIAFTAQLPDRNLQLNTSSLQTWSIYAFDSAHVNITGSIVGEVGSLGRSFITSQGILCDGSGGYYWASDTTLNLAVSTTVMGYARSERSGICLLGYGSATAGASATGNSVMIVTQSSLPQDPVAYDNGVTWLVNINPPQNVYADTIVNINGSAWIDQGPLGSFMDFGFYTVEYKPVASSLWTPITNVPVPSEVHNGLLAQWDTDGLTPGTYNLRLNTQNDLGDSIDAIIQVTLLPSILGVSDSPYSAERMHVYQDYVSGELVIDFEINGDGIGEFEIYNSNGLRIYASGINLLSSKKSARIDCGHYASGLYVVRFKSGQKIYNEKVILRN